MKNNIKLVLISGMILTAGNMFGFARFCRGFQLLGLRIKHKTLNYLLQNTCDLRYGVKVWGNSPGFAKDSETVKAAAKSILDKGMYFRNEAAGLISSGIQKTGVARFVNKFEGGVSNYFFPNYSNVKVATSAVKKATENPYDTARRSEAARKGWKTRRENAAAKAGYNVHVTVS